jgi:hypothetical protein
LAALLDSSSATSPANQGDEVAQFAAGALIE